MAAADLAPEGEQLEEAFEDRGPRRRAALAPPPLVCLAVRAVGLARRLHDLLQQRAWLGLGLGLGLRVGAGLGLGLG